MAKIYATPHDHRLYGHGHHLRVEATKVMAEWATHPFSPEFTVGDLSCGNGAISLALKATKHHLGDFASGYEFCGPLDQTIKWMPFVDLYICSETIEHLPRPLSALRLIRHKASRLILSTPVGAFADTNVEHLWAWDREGVEGLMGAAGWSPIMFASVDSTVIGEPYHYGIWVAE
jgi:hypothetical protein